MRVAESAADEEIKVSQVGGTRVQIILGASENNERQFKLELELQTEIHVCPRPQNPTLCEWRLPRPDAWFKFLNLIICCGGNFNTFILFECKSL